MTSPTWLYIVQHGDFEWSLFKVGVSANVDARMAQLQTGNPFRLRLIRTVEFQNARNAFATERALHAMLQQQCAIGEWFGGPIQSIEDALRLVLMDTRAEVLFP